MPRQHSQTISGLGYFTVTLYSRAEICEHWSALANGTKKGPEKSHYRHDYQDISLAEAIVLTALWLRAIPSTLLSDTQYDTKTKTLHLCLDGLVNTLNSLSVDPVKTQLAETKAEIFMDITRNLIHKSMFDKDFVHTEKDGKGIILFSMVN